MNWAIILLISSVFTTYHAGVYETIGEVDMHCTKTEANDIFDAMMRDLEHDPGQLFEWAFYGTGEQKDDSRKQGFVIHYDTVRYFPLPEILSVDLTLISPRGKTSGLHAEPTLSDSRHIQGVLPTEPVGVGYDSPRSLFISITDFSSMLKFCDATLTLTPGDSVQHLDIHTHCKFGWFFNLFISRKMYRNTIEWRVQQFLENLRCTAEGEPLQPIHIELE